MNCNIRSLRKFWYFLLLTSIWAVQWLIDWLTCRIDRSWNDETIFSYSIKIILRRREYHTYKLIFLTEMSFWNIYFKKSSCRYRSHWITSIHRKINELSYRQREILYTIRIHFPLKSHDLSIAEKKSIWIL